jgi:DNA (cytosine-5)-methyltransferase 1
MEPLKFIDLFAGIGGIRLGFEKAGCICAWANDHDKQCARTYIENFGNKEFVSADIKKIPSSDIPDFDILCAGFPCQPFSIAGIAKKKSLGKPHGFEDKIQGNLFHEIARIIMDKKPKAFFLENVKNLKNHDKEKTFATITETLENLGYSVFYQVINAKSLVPQNRERIYIIGFKNRVLDFKFPEIQSRNPKIKDILEENVPDKYTLTDPLWEYLQNYARKQREKNNGFGFGLVDLNSHSRTLSARYYKDGSEILIPQGEGENPRRLTPRECARLQGFPDSFRIPVSDTQAYKQFGNAVPVPVIEILAKTVAKTIKRKVSKKYCSCNPAEISGEI